MISSGSPHVRPMGRTCGEPDEIELTPMGVRLNGSGRVHADNGVVAEAVDLVVALARLDHRRRGAYLAAHDGGLLHGAGRANEPFVAAARVEPDALAVPVALVDQSARRDRVPFNPTSSNRS